MASVSRCWVAVSSVMFVFGCAHGQSNMFPDGVGVEGQSITLTCNIRTAGYTGSIDDVTGVQELVVSKMNPSGSDYENLVFYTGLIIRRRILSQSLPDTLVVNTAALPNNSYVVEAEGLTPTGGFDGNQNTMKIDVRILSLTIGDQGTYKCEATYFYKIDPRSIDRATIEKTHNLTVNEDSSGNALGVSTFLVIALAVWPLLTNWFTDCMANF